MGKPTMKFDVVAYALGEKTGYRPVLLPQDAVADLDFCREVVTEKRLAMSPEELLHAMEMVGEVASILILHASAFFRASIAVRLNPVHQSTSWSSDG